MIFIGREKEAKKIIRALEQNRNVIVTGKYGIGRTALIRHIADKVQDRFRFLFVDFTKTPGQVCQALIMELFPHKKYRKDDLLHHRYKSTRFRIANRVLSDRRRHVFVLDNIGHLTRQKLSLIRHLGWEKKYLFIAIVESYLPDEKLFSLRAELMPAELLKLSYLSKESTREILSLTAKEKNFDWTDRYIHDLSEAIGGYPLGIMETAARESKRLTPAVSKNIKEE